MIKDIRWLERSEVLETYPDGIQLAKPVKVLQAYDGEKWFDVPVAGETYDK